MTITQAPPAPSAPAAPETRVRPLLRLGGQAGAALIAIAVLCATAVISAIIVRSDIADLRATVTQRASAAAELRFALADLDAQRANQLVPGHAAKDPGTTVGDRLLALITAQQRRAEISSLLQQLGADQTQATQVRALFDALGRYDDMSGRAGYVDDNQPDRAAGHPPAAAVALSTESGDIMRDEVLPKAEALSRTYATRAAQLERTAHAAAVRAAIAVSVLGAIALLALFWWQRDLGRRYRRLLNPALLTATAAVIAVTLAGLGSFASAASEITTAGCQGLQPWSRLAEARAVAADASATQSRWLVHDPNSGAQDRSRFATLTGRLDILLAPGTDATAAEVPVYQAVLTRYDNFRADDRTLRKLLAAGNIDQAAEVLTEVQRGDVAFDFWDFATRLELLTTQQRADFDAHASAARSSMDGWPAIPAGLLGIAAALVLVGVRPRLAEYR